MKKRVLIAVVAVLALVIAVLFGGQQAGDDKPANSPSEVAVSADETSAIEAAVVDIEGRPVAGARVRAAGVSSTTDADGKARLALPPSDVEVIVEAEGYISSGPYAAVQQVHVADGDVAVEFTLRKQGSIRGVALLNGKGTAATVEPRDVEHGFIGVDVESQPDGTFELFVDPGRVRLLVLANGARATTREIRVYDGEAVEGVEVDLGGVAEVFGVLRDSSGSPLSGSVNLIAGTAFDAQELAVGSDGTFRFANVPVGEVRVVGVAEGFEESETSVEAAAGSTVEVNLTLERSFGVYGDLVPPNGGAPKPSFVYLWRGDEIEAQVRSSAPNYRIDVEPPAGATVSAISPFYGDPKPQLALPGQRADLSFGAGGTVAGRVVTTSGSPVTKFEIAVESFEIDGMVPYGAREIGTQSYASSDGTFSFGPLRPGKYWLRAAPQGFAPASGGPVLVRGSETSSELRIVAAAGGTVAGTVTDEAGQPVSRAVVTVFDPFSAFASATTRTDDRGTFTLKGVAPGRRSIRATKRGYLTQVGSGIDVTAGGSANRDLLLARARKGEKFSFQGIGAVLQADETGVVIREAMDDKPAAIFGLRQGDRIVSVDGESTKGMRLGTVVELIRGEQGVAVELQIEREGEGRLTVDVERGTVVVK